MNKPFAAGLWSLLFCGLVLWSCNTNPESITPATETIAELVYASANVKSVNQYQVFAQANGLLKDIRVKEGDTVGMGEILMTIDNNAAKLAVEQAKLAADFASSNRNAETLTALRNQIVLAKTKMNNDSLLLERQRNLWEQQIGSRIDLEQRELAFKNAQTAYEAALLQFSATERQLQFNAEQASKTKAINESMASDYLVKAASAGRVYKLLKEKGEMVTAQSPVAIVGASDAFILEMTVDEFDIRKVQTGQQVIVRLDGYPDTSFSAIVKQVIPFMNERSRSFTVEALFSVAPPTLYPNMTAEANIVIRVKENALTIPREYLQQNNTVLLEDGSKRKVATGLRDYNKVEIVNGLQRSDRIVKEKP